MNIAKIPFRGITRNTDDGLCQDGECMELINARIANNSVEPVSTPILKATFADQYTKVYYHAIAEKYIAIKADKTLVSISKDLTTVTTLSTSLTDAIGVELIGNIVCVLTNNGLRYLIYRDNQYNYLGTIPELPDIEITKELSEEIVESDSDISYNTMSINQSDYDKFNNTAYGYYLKAISKLNENGYFCNCTLIRMAFRLYDGSYVMHSPIRCLLLSPTDTITKTCPNSSLSITVNGVSQFLFNCNNKDSSSAQKFWFGCMGMKPVFNVASFDLSAWSDLIVSIDIFASQSIRNSINQEYEKNMKPIDMAKSTSKFYKIASINLKGEINYPAGNVSNDSIVLNDELSDDAYTHYNLIPKNSYVYNSRLHIYNIDTTFYDGYPLNYLYDSGEKSGTSNTIKIYTYIKTNKGTCITCKSFNNVDIPTYITPYLMYPDRRAYKMVIKFYYSGNTVKYREFVLSPHPFLNVAYYVNDLSYLSSARPTGYRSSHLQALSVAGWDSTSTDTDIETVSFKDTDNQKLKVSGLSNPFYFPARTTYQFQSDIIAVQSNTTALSQGQFGQFPLYVFCKDGVHAMQVGTDVVYATSVPVSRDVCIGQTCGIDSAVIFPTDRGLMMISGTQCQCISEAMEGWLPSCVISSPLIPKIMGVGGMSNMLSSVVFNDYIKEANIGYNYQQSEIIVANSTYPYSYVFSMKSQSWYKIDMSINSFVNVYPETYAIVLKNIYDLNNNHRSVSRIALLSRPIKFGTTAHKRVLQSALRGIIKRALSDLYLRGEQVQYRGEDLTIFKNVGFYMLGSNDAEHYELVSGKESITDLRDLITKMNKSKPYKYFMLCIVGGVRSDVSINYIELIVDESFNNRLR